MQFWDATNREDWAISELSQKGISSRAYVPGPYSIREGLPLAFDRMILDRERESRKKLAPHDHESLLLPLVLLRAGRCYFWRPVSADFSP